MFSERREQLTAFLSLALKKGKQECCKGDDTARIIFLCFAVYKKVITRYWNLILLGKIECLIDIHCKHSRYRTFINFKHIKVNKLFSERRETAHYVSVFGTQKG